MIKKDSLYFIEKNRLNTFKNWIFSENHACSAQKMAEAGFIFIGSSKEPDLVKCFFCNKQLDGWEQDDDPWKEHVNHSPKCEFAIHRTPEESMTLNTFLNTVDTFFIKQYEDYYDSKINAFDEVFKSLEAKYSES